MTTSTPPLKPRPDADRLRSEREFHDHQAEQRARTLRPDDYRVDDAAYLGHESWIAPAFAALGDVRGKRVLDLGCGHGMASVVLARRGARVTACDLSLGYLREARRRAEVNGVSVPFLTCNGEYLPFADETFECIWGNAVLHHLDLARATRELHRVLASGGVAVFCEPWGGNPLLNWARRRLHYPGKNRTADETPLRPQDLDHLRGTFASLHVEGHQLLAMASRVMRTPRLTSVLTWCDGMLLRRIPAGHRYCRYVVLVARKAA